MHLFYFSANFGTFGGVTWIHWWAVDRSATGIAVVASPWLISLLGEGDEALFQGVPVVRPAAGSLSTRVWERAGGHELSWACRPAAADKSLVDSPLMDLWS